MIAVCTQCRRNTPPRGATVCRSCMEAEDTEARADGVWERFFSAVERMAERLGDEDLLDAAREIRVERTLVTTGRDA